MGLQHELDKRRAEANRHFEENQKKMESLGHRYKDDKGQIREKMTFRDLQEYRKLRKEQIAIIEKHDAQNSRLRSMAEKRMSPHNV